MSEELANFLTTWAAIVTGLAAIAAVVVSALAMIHQSNRNKMFALATKRQAWLDRFGVAMSRLISCVPVLTARKDIKDENLANFFEQGKYVHHLIIGKPDYLELSNILSKLSNRLGYHMEADTDYFEAGLELSAIVSEIDEMVGPLIEKENKQIDALISGKTA
ncbi:MAG: hypothetical protein AAGG45_05290 [Pseudomonadota bacterium]